VSIPTHTDVSIDTIRGYFNAYLSHKFLIDHLVNMKAVGLVNMEWVDQSKAPYLHDKLIQLQNALNFNVKNLAQLVRDYFTLFAWL